jgi:hypothetical protein
MPPGIHQAEWLEVVARFGTTSHRRWLLEGLHWALRELVAAGCGIAYLDGSFVTDKAVPHDYDLCWEPDGVDLARLDPAFSDLAPPRAMQHVKYRGDLLPNYVESNSSMPFLDFFQVDKNTCGQKGIIVLDPRKVGP